MSLLPEIFAWSLLVVLLGLFVWALTKLWRVIPPGQEALQYAAGSYVKTLRSGRRYVNPLMPVKLEPEGTTARFHVGERAQVLEPIGGPDSPGKVVVAGVEFVAVPLRPSKVPGATIPAGDVVFIQGPKPPDAVYVSPIRTRKPGGSLSHHL
jgi:hypothetical protein